MPTTLPRHAITETPQIAAMLDDAAVLWPDASRADLIRRLLSAGHDVVTDAQTDRRRSRLAAVRAAAGSMPDVWPTNAAQSLKDEWPA